MPYRGGLLPIMSIINWESVMGVGKLYLDGSECQGKTVVRLRLQQLPQRRGNRLERLGRNTDRVPFGASGLHVGLIVRDFHRHQRIPDIGNPLTPDGDGRREESSDADLESVTNQRGLQHGSGAGRAGAMGSKRPSPSKQGCYGLGCLKGRSLKRRSMTWICLR